MTGPATAVIGAVLVALTACTGSGDRDGEPGATPTAASPTTDAASAPRSDGDAGSTITPTGADMQSLLALRRDLARAAAQHKGDCGRTAAALERVVADHQPFVDRMRRFQEDEAGKKVWDARYRAESEELMTSLVGDVGACIRDPAIAAVWKKMR